MAIETEKKFLLTHFPSSLLTNGVFICQGYMTKSKQGVVRVRIFGNQGYLTLKGPTVNISRKEFEYPVPLADAKEMLALFCNKPFIEKTRYHFNFKGSEWVIDQFSGENKGLLIAEIELNSVDQPFETPDWIGREVSHDPRYFNSNLIDYPYSKWSSKDEQ